MIQSTIIKRYFLLGLTLAGFTGLLGCAAPKFEHPKESVNQTSRPPGPEIVVRENPQRTTEIPLLIGLKEALQEQQAGFLELVRHSSDTEEEHHTLISLRCQHADLHEVLKRFVEIGALNLVIHPGVSGTVTARLDRVPWIEALKSIIQMNGLSFAIEGNVLRVF